MTKAELIDAVVQNAGVPDLTKKATGEILDAVFEAVKDSISADGRFSAPGFGTFSVKTRLARSGRNPRTGETIEIPASKSVGFKPAPALKQAL